MSRLFLIWVFLLIALPGLARTRCVVQVTAGDMNMTIIQLCTTDKQGSLTLPIARPIPYSLQGPVLPPVKIDSTKVNMKKQGCDIRVTPDINMSINNSSQQCQVQVSYSFPHHYKDYFVLFKNIADEAISLQVVTRRTPVYYPQVRPLVPYAFSEEEDNSGAWQYMSLAKPVAPGASITIMAARQPDRGFIGGWAWLWISMGFAGVFLLISWRHKRA